MPIHLERRKSKKGITLMVKERKTPLDYEIKEVFVGYNTLFSLLGFAIGALLVGRSFWEYGKIYLGLPITILIGVFVFTLCGVILKRFHE